MLLDLRHNRRNRKQYESQHYPYHLRKNLLRRRDAGYFLNIVNIDNQLNIKVIALIKNTRPSLNKTSKKGFYYHCAKVGKKREAKK